MKRFLLILILSAAAFAQTTYRVDPVPVMTTPGNTPPGAFAPLHAIPGATIKICSDSACGIAATAYTDATGSIPCPVLAPVVQAGTNVCVSVTDQLGNFGFWLLPGQYYYTITVPNGTRFGPFPITTSSANLGLFTASGAGAVPRPIQSKMSDTISAKDYGAVGNGIADDTASVQAAINQGCSIGGKVFVPPGNYNISSTLRFNTCHNMEFGGVSDGQFTNRGVIFQWFGASGGVMMEFYASEWSRIHDFTLDGRSIAGVGFWHDADTVSPVVRSSQRNVIDHLYVQNITQAPGYCYQMTGHTLANGDDISQNLIQNSSFSTCLTGVYQDGTQTLVNEFNNNTFHNNTNYDFHANKGDINLIHNTLLSRMTVAHVAIESTALYANLERNYYENNVPQVGAVNYLFPFSAIGRPYTTNLIGEKVQWINVGGKIMDFEQAGTINVIGGFADDVVGQAKAGVWYFNSGYAPVDAQVNLIGNVWAFNDIAVSLGPRVQARIMSSEQVQTNVFEDNTGSFNSGNATLTATDSPFTSSMVGYVCWVQNYLTASTAVNSTIIAFIDVNNVTLAANAGNSSTLRYFRCGRPLNTLGSTYTGYSSRIPTALTADAALPLLHLRENDQVLSQRNAVLREQNGVVFLSRASKDDVSSATFSDWFSCGSVAGTAIDCTFLGPVRLGTGHSGFQAFIQDFPAIHYGTMAGFAEQVDTLNITVDTVNSGDSCVAGMPNLTAQLLTTCTVTGGNTAVLRVFNTSPGNVFVVDQTVRITFFKWTTP